MRPTAGRRAELLSELSPTLTLAGPVILGQIGLMLMNLVDTAIVGGLGASAVAAVGVGNAFFAATLTFGLGLLMGLDRVVSYAVGAGRHDEVSRSLAQGLWLAVAASVPLTALLWVAAGSLDRLGVDPEVVPEAAAYLRATALTVLPSLVFSALRLVLQAMGDTKPAMVVMIGANVVNAAAVWSLVYGGLGLPAMGVAGAGWGTLASRVLMCAALAVYAWRKVRVREWRPQRSQLVPLVRLGLPTSLQLLAEVGVFALATVLAAGLGAVPGAAHQVVLQIASFTFMVPLGLSAAGAVRVGQALGRGDPDAARRAGWVSVSLGVGFMVVSATALITLADPILAIFRLDAPVVELARWLIVCAGVFQIFDGLQVTLSGVLRGTGDTMSPMLANLVGHWAIGLPIGYWLGLRAGWGAPGLWVGLAAGLGVVSVVLLVIWRRRIGTLAPAGMVVAGE